MIAARQQHCLLTSGHTAAHGFRKKACRGDRSSFCGTVAVIAAKQQHSLPMSGHTAIHKFFLLRACCKDNSKATAFSSHERTHCDMCKTTHTKYDGLMWALSTS
jgi:hypothetical protein